MVDERCFASDDVSKRHSLTISCFGEKFDSRSLFFFRDNFDDSLILLLNCIMMGKGRKNVRFVVILSINIARDSNIVSRDTR